MCFFLLNLAHVFHFVLSVVSTDFDGDPAIVIMGLEPSASHHNGYCFLSLDEIERLIMDGFKKELFPSAFLSVIKTMFFRTRPAWGSRFF